MMPKGRLPKLIPVVLAGLLVVAACGGNGNGPTTAAQQQPVSADAVSAPAAAPAAPAPAAGAAPATGGAAGAQAEPSTSTGTSSHHSAAAASTRASVSAAATGSQAHGPSTEASKRSDAKAAAPSQAKAAAAPDKAVAPNNGATDVGVTKDQIRFGGVNMHGMALGNILITPIVNAIRAEMAAANDRGGVFGRRLSHIDCDDGPGEVARAKACIKKMVGEDGIFALLGGATWATASIHDDLKQYHLPFFGAWAYSQTEWQDPFMFPTHMSMIHEAMAGAHWALKVLNPKTYGLICLTSPEMQLACNEVQRIMDASGSKLVKRANVSISETSMASYVLAMRAAAPEAIIHYVINPATITKFIIEAAQQGYWPPKGISGNHLMVEGLGSLFGQWPVGRYWTNTTYKIWGSEYMATMNKYALANRGINNHVSQASYVATEFVVQSLKKVGPDVTRDRMMAAWSNGTVWSSDASLDQKFAYTPAERGENWNREYGQGREFMYKYTSTNTGSKPDGSPTGWELDPNNGVIYTN